MDLGLRGKVAAVVGGSSGIGLEIARGLTQEGAKVSIAGRDADRLARAKERLGDDVGIAALDIRDADAVQSWIQGIVAEHGDLHIVVTNAGGPPPGSTSDFGLPDYRAALELSMLSHIGLVQQAMPLLKRAGWGRVLLVASETVRDLIPKFALSNIVRSGLVGYAKTLVHELGPCDITVNVLAPGYTATAPLLDEIDGDVDAGLRRVAAQARIPLGRVAAPEEVAAAGVFLLSARAGFVTGTVQVVDGGRSLGV